MIGMVRVMGWEGSIERFAFGGISDGMGCITWA